MKQVQASRTISFINGILDEILRSFILMQILFVVATLRPIALLLVDWWWSGPALDLIEVLPLIASMISFQFSRTYTSVRCCRSLHVANMASYLSFSLSASFGKIFQTTAGCPVLRVCCKKLASSFNFSIFSLALFTSFEAESFQEAASHDVDPSSTALKRSFLMASILSKLLF